MIYVIKVTMGESIHRIHSYGLTINSESLSGNCVANTFGNVSLNISKTKATMIGASTTPHACKKYIAIVVPIVDTMVLTMLFPVRMVLRSLSGSLIILKIEMALLFFCLIRKSNRVLLREKKAVSESEKKAETKRSTKKSINMKTIVVGEKCNESIRTPFFIPFLFQG